MSNKNIDAFLSLVDGILPPEQQQPIEEISGILVPQFEMIVALSGVEAITLNRHFDTHHLFWPRSEYRTQAEKAFRRQFVTPINRGIHDELHANLEPPTKPPRSVMLGYLALLDRKEHGQQAQATT